MDMVTAMGIDMNIFAENVYGVVTTRIGVDGVVAMGM